MNKSVGAASVSETVGVYDDSGLPVIGLVAATFPSVQWRKSRGSANSLTLPINDLPSATAPWADGGLFPIGQGQYRLDLSDELFTTADDVAVWSEASGKHMMPLLFEVGESNADLADDIADVPAATAALLSGADLTILAAFSGGELTIHKDAEYSVAQGNHQDLDASSLPDLTGGEGRLHIYRPKGTPIIDVALSVINPGQPDQKIRFALSSAESGKVNPPEVLSGTIIYKVSGASAFAPFRVFSVPTRRL